MVDTFALTPLSRILPPTPTLSDITNIMTEGETTDEMVKRAARNLIKYPKLVLPYHMRGCEFTKEQSLNRALQMKVRRLADKLRPPPTQQPADAEPPQPPIPSEGASTDDAAAVPLLSATCKQLMLPPAKLLL